ncbi:hypothetical protein ACP4OV_002371 [Aristida adscensionis]
MEIAVVSSVLRMLGPKIFTFLQENHQLRADLELNTQFVKNELGMIAAALEEHDRRSWSNGPSEEQRVWIQIVRDLAYSMEDIIDRFFHRVSLEASASPFRRRSHRLKTTLLRTEFAAKIRELKKVSDEIAKLRQKYVPGGGRSSDHPGASAASTSPSPDGDTAPVADLVGMDVPLGEIMELIREDEGQPKQLKVISIVGFGGLGKTVLAKQVYTSVAVGNAYEPRVWVSASEMGAGDVLKEILRQVRHGSRKSLSECLRSKRFFIVIDDMRTEYWNTIKNAFPKDVELNSRVIVTTAVWSIANACSAGNGHVYLMRTLEKGHSDQLFFREASSDYYEPAEPVLKKCDGLPLALVTTAQLLQSKGQLTPEGCADLCRCMGRRLETEHTLERMKRVLLQNYLGLRGHVLKACLLYLGIFPCGHLVRRKRLIRRWLAERFVEADQHSEAMESFKELLDRSIIKHIGMSNNMEAKTCQIHGMMLDFILHKSTSENFITLYDQDCLPSKIRRLSLHHNDASDRPKTDIDLSLIRSLTVFGKADQHVLQFSKYELLQVLDLEECEGLNDEHVKKICNLFLLRYLSLGGDITELPKEISRLKFLETLDARGAKAKSLPICIEVIMLPCLIHLLGVFRLPEVGKKMRKVQTFLSEKSNMETLAGFIVDKSSVFPSIMSHMDILKKVKVFCEPTADDNLSGPLQKFIQRGTKVNDGRSLSLSFKGSLPQFLDFHLEGNSYLSSLKLHGKLRSLPPFVTELRGVTELCLSSPDQLSMDVLTALSNVRALHYLKLIAKHLDRFVITQGGFKNLRRLCIVVQSITSLENQEGALPQLESLWLLCKEMNGICGARIEYLRRLKEVALDDRVSKKTEEKWKQVAKKHLKQPRVTLVKIEEADQSEIQQIVVEDEPREVPESTAASTPEAADSQRQVHPESTSAVVHKKSEGMTDVPFSSRKANVRTSVKASCNGNIQDGVLV